MTAVQIKAAKGVDPRAVKLLGGRFSAGQSVPTSEAYYIVTGTKPNAQYPDDLIAVCVALGIRTIDGSECPDNLTADQFATLQANVSG